MSGLYVTVVETSEGVTIPESDFGLCSKAHAAIYAKRLSKNSDIISAKVGMVCLGEIDELLKGLIPAPVWDGIDNAKKDEYRDKVKKWMNG